MPHPTRAYRPQQAQDVTAEMAIMSGRGKNGRASSVTELMRPTLSRPTTTDPVRDRVQKKLDLDARSAFTRMKAGGGGDIEAELQRRDEEERIAARREDARIEREYEDMLARWRADGVGESIEGDSVEGERDELEPERERELADDEAIAALEREAQAIARRIAEKKGRSRSTAAAPVAAAVTARPSATAAAATPPSPVQMRQVFAADVDRLWDWLRQDVSAKVGQDELFLGRGFGTSIELHAYIAKILELGWALRAGYVNNIHAGFVMVQQDASRNIGMLHVYCAPAFRGQYRELLPYLLGAGRALIPPTMHLGISNHHDPRTMAALLAQYGFVAQTLFIQYGKTGG